ncbi:hypothetical protein K3495_g6616 [Podosphaera aphanis]|nr:hypothetical protein K3495_g6616 [Podosphaera aphanis]
MANLQNSTPREYHLGGGIGFDILATTSDDFIVPPATPSQPSRGTSQTESLDVNIPHTQEETNCAQPGLVQTSNQQQALQPQTSRESTLTNRGSDYGLGEQDDEQFLYNQSDIEDPDDEQAPQNQGESATQYDTPMQPFEPPLYAGKKRVHSPTPSSSPDSRIIFHPGHESLVNQQELPQRSDLMTRDEGESHNEYDTLMGPFEPPSFTGQKRPHSQSPTPSLSSTPASTMVTRRGRTVQRHDYKHLNSGKTAAHALVCVNPKSWTEAMKSPDASLWMKAAEAEFTSLIPTSTTRITDQKNVPKNRAILTGEWVFKRKTHADGSLDKYKARWTARGFTQRQGIDYFETFAPTPQSDTIRLLLAVGHHLGWHRLQGDIPTAFLNPDLDVTLYTQIPEWFAQEGKVVKLEKGLYDLKQSAALWHDTAKSELKK